MEWTWREKLSLSIEEDEEYAASRYSTRGCHCDASHCSVIESGRLSCANTKHMRHRTFLFCCARDRKCHNDARIFSRVCSFVWLHRLRLSVFSFHCSMWSMPLPSQCCLPVAIAKCRLSVFVVCTGMCCRRLSSSEFKCFGKYFSFHLVFRSLFVCRFGPCPCPSRCLYNAQCTLHTHISFRIDYLNIFLSFRILGWHRTMPDAEQNVYTLLNSTNSKWRAVAAHCYACAWALYNQRNDRRTEPPDRAAHYYYYYVV